MTYVAGWNMPGYLPETDPVEFDTFTDAIDYLKWSLIRWDLDDSESYYSAISWLDRERKTLNPGPCGLVLTDENVSLWIDIKE